MATKPDVTTDQPAETPAPAPTADPLTVSAPNAATAQNTPIPGGGSWVWDDATRQWMPAPQYA